MKKCKKRINSGIWTALAACFLLAAFLPALTRAPAPVPLPRARRTLLTVWLCGDGLGASGWVKKQAAAFEKAHSGVSLWVRSVSQADLRLLEEDYAHSAPDVLIFTLGEDIAFSRADRIAPLCRAGYALVRHAKERVTPAPTSLFGVTPAPEMHSAAGVPREDWPETILADDGLGAYYLLRMNAPSGALLLPKAQLPAAFLRDKSAAALLSAAQIRSLTAQGAAVDVLQASSESDLVLYGAVMQEADALADGFLQLLLSEAAQRELSSCGLISVQGYRLYGSDQPILQAVEAALADSAPPDPALWLSGRSAQVQTGRALYK